LNCSVQKVYTWCQHLGLLSVSKGNICKDIIKLLQILLKLYYQTSIHVHEQNVEAVLWLGVN